ncbi:MAG: MFS transporter [Sphingobium sp.]|nr:MFS transporter [Sphingobium sp.]
MTTENDNRDASPARSAGPVRSIIGGSLGNLVEWYDWYVYSAFTLYFAPVIFPSDSPTAQLLSAAAIFAVGFLMRPLGAWLMGVYADRHGRKAGLTLSVMMMGGGSMLIACIPSYDTIGVAAPALLLFARLLQGLSVGGEYGASATYLSEMALPGRRGFFSSFQYVTLIAGQLLALSMLLLLQLLLTEDQLDQWGWRIPFVVGGFMALLVFYLRRGLQETQAFKNNAARKDAPKSSGLMLFREHPREVFTVIAMTAGGTLAFYAYSTYMQKYLVNSVGFGRQTATAIMASALFIYMLAQPVMGGLSDRIGRKPLLVGFGVLGMLCTVPIFTTLQTVTSSFTAFILILGGLMIVSGYTSINAVVKAEMFPANIRALGVALPYALANTIFGGTAEYVALQLKQWDMESGFYWYVSAMIGVSLIVYIMMPETSKDDRLAK